MKEGREKVRGKDAKMMTEKFPDTIKDTQEFQ